MNCLRRVMNSIDQVETRNRDERIRLIEEVWSSPNLKVFTLAELKRATKNFKPVTTLVKGGFEIVFFKGWIDENTLAPTKNGVGMAVTVKKFTDNTQVIEEWKGNMEVDFIVKFVHPNLVRMFGYCVEGNNLFLVHEFPQKGNLESVLFSKDVVPPSWETRIRIAMDAARGLDFLHTSNKSAMYRDFNASNILLEHNYGAKLSDFGFATMGASNALANIPSYADPEYVSTGYLYTKSDVYGFGVVLLEMLTGLRAFDVKRPRSQRQLVDLCKPMLDDWAKVKEIIDSRIVEYPPEGAHKLAGLIQRCLKYYRESRPSMSEVLLHLETISTISLYPQRPKAHHRRHINTN